MATLAELEASIRFGTFKDDTGRTPQAGLYAAINEEMLLMARRLAVVIPDRYTKYGSDFTGADTYDFSGSVTDLSKLLVVQRKDGTRYFDLPLARATDPEASATLSFRLRGAARVDLFPSTAASGQTLRLKYLYKPTKLVNPGDVLDMPDGCDSAIIELVSARVRGREEEDPGLHLARREKIWTETFNSLLPFYQGTVETVEDVNEVW